MTVPRLYRTAIRLADGRELIYFDEAAGQDRTLPDQRNLPIVEHHCQVRFDQLTGEWIAIAAHRQGRTYHPPADQCPLCPSTPLHQSEIPASDYDVVVFENRFPSFAGQGRAAEVSGLVDIHPGNGRCEVVCFTSDHHGTMSALPDSRLRSVVEVWADRTAALSQLPGIEQVFCFENRGIEIGVTLEHPHGQIYGYPYVTPVTATMAASARRYREVHGSNLFGDLLDAELASDRVIAANEHWVAFVPFAARWPIEVHLYPRRQLPDLPATSADERDAFVPIYREALRRMEALYDEPLPLITGWHQAPVHTARDDWWLHLRLTSIRRDANKIKYLAGSESGMGAFISGTTPEQVAARLRAAT